MSPGEIAIARGSAVPAEPRVSVVIPAYAPRWLDEALESVRGQSLFEREIVVVDDGSPEPVRPDKTDDLVLVRQANDGPGGARNRGVAVARAPLVAFLDADDRWLPRKLERQLAFHRAHPALVLSCTDLRLFGEDAEPVVQTLGERYGVAGPTISLAQVFYENCITSSTVMLRREAYRRVGGMTPGLRLGEDYGLWLRLALCGPLGYLAEVLVERRLHPESLMVEARRQDAWLPSERRVYEEFLAERPALRREPFVRAALARLEVQAGYGHLVAAEWAAARRASTRALRHQPGSRRAWLTLLRAMLHVGPLGR